MAGNVGSCSCCKKKWGRVKPHNTPYSARRGMFPLCETCWGKMTVEERLPFYEALIAEWKVMDGYDLSSAERDAIKAAVLAGK